MWVDIQKLLQKCEEPAHVCWKMFTAITAQDNKCDNKQKAFKKIKKWIIIVDILLTSVHHGFKLINKLISAPFHILSTFSHPVNFFSFSHPVNFFTFSHSVNFFTFLTPHINVCVHSKNFLILFNHSI